MELPPPARYTPWTKGVYEVAPALRPFGTDFGNGEADARVFQLDTELERYQANKRTALRERRGKYVRGWKLSRDVERAVIEFVVTRLTTEYPELYQADWEGDARVLESQGRRWVLPSAGPDTDSPALDLLMRLVPEDMAVVRTLSATTDDGKREVSDWIAYLHLCSPSHWAAEEKVGRSFFDTHTPIPAFEKVNAAAPGLVDAMVNKGPFVRFVWGVESDDRLNHHPEPPPGHDPAVWDGRDFRGGRFWVRTERQVVWGLSQVGAAVFTIRVGFVPDTVVLASEELRTSLIAGIESMSPAALAYKGLARGREDLLKLLYAEGV
ncbi:MAG: heme-dependent oxidative N-demethylase subunit alpha family protein [Fimbriimonas sp.]